MPIVLDGTAGITTPAVDSVARFATGDMPLGSVLQVVTETFITRFATTSTSFVSTGIEASITPSSTSNKILVFISQTFNNEASGRNVFGTIFRGSTDLGGAANTGMVSVGITDRVIASGNLVILDSPNTTSSVTYSSRVRSSTGDLVEVPASLGQKMTITLMEIAA